MTDALADAFDRADTLLDAVRLKVDGQELQAALTAIPVLKQDPILAGAVLIHWLARTIHTYANAIGTSPGEVMEQLWTKPNRDAGP